MENVKTVIVVEMGYAGMILAFVMMGGKDPIVSIVEEKSGRFN